MAAAATSGNTYTLGTLGIGAQTLNISGGPNVAAGTAGITFGATTLSGALIFNITNPTAGGISLLTLGAITDNGNRLTLKGNGNFGQSAAWSAGSGGLTLDATYTGNALLSQTNLYTGATAVNGGLLEVSGSIATSSATAVASGRNLPPRQHRGRGCQLRHRGRRRYT